MVVAFFESDRDLNAKFNRCLWELAKASLESVQWIFIYNNKEERSIEQVKMLFPHAQIEITDEENPSEIFNQGLVAAEGEFVTFVWPGAMMTQESINQFLDIEDYTSPVYYLESEIADISEQPTDAYRYGLCQCLQIYCLNQLIINKKSLVALGGFNTLEELGPHCDWELMVRLTKEFNFERIGYTSLGIHAYLRNYPFKELKCIEDDLAHRLVLGNKLKDLEGKKVTILMGYWDYVHTQICFQNYFKYLRGKGILSYKILLDHLVKPKDIEQSDLVIFTRTRQELALESLDYCREHGIRTLFMLDDNWFHLAKDWPEICGHIYTVDNKEYRVFIEIIAGCSGVLVYNKFLQEDAQAYNKNVYCLKTNIDMEIYKTEGRREEKQKITCGYVGTVRFEDKAFKALKAISKDRDDVELIVSGILKNDYKNYFNYVSEVIAVHPDILIAPLDDSRSSMSKCPNKYLEIAAIGAAGIYSDVHPYKDVVEDGHTGILVRDNEMETWYKAIEDLIEDKEKRQRISMESCQDVKGNYDTKKRLVEFVAFIMKFLGEGQWNEEEIYLGEL